jgi:hypothetical protein
MMREEVVVKKWLEEQHFLDLIGATNLIRVPIVPKWQSIVMKGQDGRTYRCRIVLYHTSRYAYRNLCLAL